MVTISEDHYIQDVAKTLAELGLAKQQVLAKAASIIGTADAKAIARMRRVDGVLEIQAEADTTPAPLDPG